MVSSIARDLLHTVIEYLLFSQGRTTDSKFLRFSFDPDLHQHNKTGFIIWGMACIDKSN